MAQKILFVEDNDAPAIVLTLTRKPNGTAIDVTGCTVNLYINLSGVLTNSGHTGCTPTTPASGIVTYTIGAADFATPGTYDCEVKITYADTTIETIYEKFNVVARTKLTQA